MKPLRQRLLRLRERGRNQLRWSSSSSTISIFRPREKARAGFSPKRLIAPQERQRKSKPTSAALTGTFCTDGSAVHLDQLFDDRQAEAESSDASAGGG
jgi:hypothetical protein